ncbi:HTH domain-containing protein [Streptomyces sp900105755]|uniref:HTH domain-containing protein n=1 Tax=Streptomyces sp. 900105755 TaxID=3154389 RepID=UPI00331A087F
MTRLPEASAEPRRTRGGAGGAAPADAPSWHRQKVKIPKRVWGSGSYSPGAVAYWAQLAALGHRPDGCRAHVSVLAAYMGDSKRSAERALAELSAPGPEGEPELTTVRRTGSDGDGETAERRVRPAARGEHFAYVPVLAAKRLRRPLFVLYCALAYATTTKTPVTAAELAELLAVTERSVRRMTDELEGLGWITVHRRAGGHGRHLYDVHDLPLQPVVAAPGGPDTHGGSGAHTDGGSLAIKEDAGLTDESTTTGRGGFRRRRDDGKCPAPPVDTVSNRAGGNYPVAAVPASLRGRVRRSAPPAYAGPQLTLSRDAWAVVGPVLDPVADLLPDVSAFVMRRIVREVLRQVRNDGIWPEDIRDQVARMRAWTPTEDLTDPGRWLLGAVLPVRSRCGRTGCHWGFLAHTGQPCKACAEIDQARTRERSAHPPHTGARPPRRPAWHECTDCGRPSRQPLPAGLCRTCA